MVKVKEDLTGRVFGKLTVLRQAEDYTRKNGKKEAQWLCECSCPTKTQVIVSGGNLKSGNTKSCGCIYKNIDNKVKVKQDLTGKIFGRLKVLKQVEDYISKKGVHYSVWLCECSCEGHNKIEVRGDHLKNGQIKSCGCLVKDTNLKKNKKYNKYDLSHEIGIGYFKDEGNFYFDLEDYDKIKNYYWINQHGYACTKEQKDNVVTYTYMHRLIMEAKKTEIIDHIDRNKLNNCKNNLRITNNTGNARNASISKNNTSGIIGVSYDKSRELWVAQISINYKTINLGRYANKEDAIYARLKAEAKYFGEFAPQKCLFEQYEIQTKEYASTSKLLKEEN